MLMINDQTYFWDTFQLLAEGYNSIIIFQVKLQNYQQDVEMSRIYHGIA